MNPAVIMIRNAYNLPLRIQIWATRNAYNLALLIQIWPTQLVKGG